MGRSTLISLNTTQARIQTPSRMNKLLMLAFMVTLMGLMATASPQEEVEELELEDLAEDDALEEVAESREAREAGRNGRGECRGRNCQNRRPKKGLKKGRKAQKKSAKKSRKSKKSKKAKKAGKSEKAERGGSKGSSRSQGGCGRSSTDYTCLVNAMTYLNLTKTQVTNYLKQQGRIVAANKTGEKKNGKKGIFASTAQRIIRSGGGNSAALSCQGSTTSSGAKNLTNLATLLNGCEAKVKAACATENMPLPNMTEVSACVSSMETFKGMVDKCQMMKENGTEACTCWSNANFTTLAATIRKCKISTTQKAVVAQLSLCKGNFSACKQAEDDGMKAMSSCSTSKSDLLASAKTLKANSAGLDSAKTKVDSLANSTTKKRAAAASCAEIITIVTEIKTIVAANPENSTVTTLTTKITSVASTVTCSDAEKTSLVTSSSDLAAAKESVDGSLATIKEDLEIATGSAPTDSEISSATTASSTSATAASSARRNIVARHLLNRFNLN